MSWAATSYVKPLRKAPNGEAVTKGEKLVLHNIADYYNDEKGYAWVSLSRLAYESLHSRRGVVLTLQSLERKGLLCIVRHPDSATKRVTNHYRFPGLESPSYPRPGEASSLGLGKPVPQAREAASLDVGKAVHQPSEVSSLGLGKPVPHIFPEDLSSDLSKDIGAGPVPDTGLRSAYKKRSAEQPKGEATRRAYAEGHLKRYRVEPVRNARTNALLSQLVDRLGAEEAPLVAAFYVSLDTPLYVKAGHPLNLLVRDCESLRTQWKSSPLRASLEGPKAFQPVTRVKTPPAECPPDAAEALSKILGRDAFNFSAAREGAA